jgi:hypothetical protein
MHWIIARGVGQHQLEIDAALVRDSYVLLIVKEVTWLATRDGSHMRGLRGRVSFNVK